MHHRKELFESSVISYGSKTQWGKEKEVKMFESSVISYGSKTSAPALSDSILV